MYTLDYVCQKCILRNSSIRNAVRGAFHKHSALSIRSDLLHCGALLSAAWPRTTEACNANFAAQFTVATACPACPENSHETFAKLTRHCCVDYEVDLHMYEQCSLSESQGNFDMLVLCPKRLCRFFNRFENRAVCGKMAAIFSSELTLEDLLLRKTDALFTLL